jgi:hypothetical protein
LGWRTINFMKACFENGAIQYGHSSLTPVRYYALKPLPGSSDMAVIEVAENIGDYTGYFGLAFDTLQQSFSGQLLYNLSYPKQQLPGYYTDSLNGDTMYMRYGYGTHNPSSPYFNFAFGGNGEYVSPYFDENFRITGQRWSIDYNTKMTARYFYFLKHVLQSIPVGLKEFDKEDGWNIYPNPAFDQLICSVKRRSANTTLQIFSMEGKLLRTMQAVEQGQIEIDVSGLSPGVYFFVLKDDSERSLKKFAKQ